MTPCKEFGAKGVLQREHCKETLAKYPLQSYSDCMNPMSHHSYAALRHQELIAECSELRRRSTLRRLAKAARLNRRADDLNRRAVDLVERTHS